MRVVVQRVTRAQVTVNEDVVGAIGPGLLVLLAIRVGDELSQLEFLCDKLVGLRVFPDADGKMNLSVGDVAGELLVVSQFTLYGDCRKGRRPSFLESARPEVAEPMVEMFVARLRQSGLKVETGRFGAMMAVELVNDGPVTFVIDSPE